MPEIQLTDQQAKSLLKQVNPALTEENGYNLHKQEVTEHYTHTKSDAYESERQTTSSFDKAVVGAIAILGGILLCVLALLTLFESISAFVIKVVDKGPIAIMLALLVLLGITYVVSQGIKALRKN